MIKFFAIVPHLILAVTLRSDHLNLNANTFNPIANTGYEPAH